MYKVKAQVNRTAYRSRHSTEVTRVAHVKATKHKANPATDEVYVENWNHGLAWSQREELCAAVQRLTLIEQRAGVKKFIVLE